MVCCTGIAHIVGIFHDLVNLVIANHTEVASHPLQDCVRISLSLCFLRSLYLKMSLRIDIPPGKYTANAPVLGTVTLVGEEDIGVARISITFSGRCESKICHYNGDVTYRAHVPLFTYTIELFRGPCTLHPNEPSWPFAFRFPARRETRGGDRFPEEQSQSSFGGSSLAPIFNNDPYQELPRSIMPFENGPNSRRSGYVSYQLEAILILIRDGTRVFASHIRSTTKLLHLVKPREKAEPSPQMLRLPRPWFCHSMHLLPGYEERSLTFKERLSSMRSKNVPCAKFSLVLQLPKVGVIGQKLPLLLNIEHDAEQSSCLAPPTVFLKSVSVRLQVHSSLRCINDSHRQSEIAEDWDEEVVIAVLHKATPMPIPDHAALPIDLRDQMFLTLRESSAFPGLVPSYSTFNLAVQYWLRVKVSVECGQKSFKPEFVSKDFELLPGEWVGRYQNVPISNGEGEGSASELLPPFARNPELWNQ